MLSDSSGTPAAATGYAFQCMQWLTTDFFAVLQFDRIPEAKPRERARMQRLSISQE